MNFGFNFSVFFIIKIIKLLNITKKMFFQKRLCNCRVILLKKTNNEKKYLFPMDFKIMKKLKKDYRKVFRNLYVFKVF